MLCRSGALLFPVAIMAEVDGRGPFISPRYGTSPRHSRQAGSTQAAAAEGRIGE